MEEFKNSNLILIKEDLVKQLDSKDQLNDIIFGNKYSTQDQEQKEKIRYENALIYAILNHVNVIKSDGTVVYKKQELENPIFDNDGKDIIIDDENTHILSLCRLNIIKLIEKKGANIFLTGNEPFQNANANYLILNCRIDSILDNYIKNRRIRPDIDNKEV